MNKHTFLAIALLFATFQAQAHEILAEETVNASEEVVTMVEIADEAQDTPEVVEAILVEDDLLVKSVTMQDNAVEDLVAAVENTVEAVAIAQDAAQAAAQDADVAVQAAQDAEVAAIIAAEQADQAAVAAAIIGTEEAAQLAELAEQGAVEAHIAAVEAAAQAKSAQVSQCGSSTGFKAFVAGTAVVGAGVIARFAAPEAFKKAFQKVEGFFSSPVTKTQVSEMVANGVNFAQTNKYPLAFAAVTAAVYGVYSYCKPAKTVNK